MKNYRLKTNKYLIDGPGKGGAIADVASYARYSGDEVAVDPETGRVKVLNAVLAPDVERAINLLIVEGIMEGGVGLDIGFALMGQIHHEQGTVVNPDFMDYRVPMA